MPSEISDITVTILGSGTCVPSLKRSSCSAMMDVGGAKLLFDTGPGTMRQLLKTNTTIFDIDYVFYSHFHPDHTAEFVPLLFATKYPNVNQRRKSLTIIAGRGFFDFYKKLKNVYGRWIEIAPGILKLEEFETKERDHRDFKAFSVASMPVEHNEESLAFRIMSTNGLSVVYSGDTDYCESLIKLSHDADILICESALPNELRVNGHLTPSLAGEIADRAGVKKLVLTHFYPECDQVDIEAQCRKTYSGPLILAEDLMRINVSH